MSFKIINSKEIPVDSILKYDVPVKESQKTSKTSLGCYRLHWVKTNHPLKFYERLLRKFGAVCAALVGNKLKSTQWQIEYKNKNRVRLCKIFYENQPAGGTPPSTSTTPLTQPAPPTLQTPTAAVPSSQPPVSQTASPDALPSRRTILPPVSTGLSRAEEARRHKALVDTIKARLEVAFTSFDRKEIENEFSQEDDYDEDLFDEAWREIEAQKAGKPAQQFSSTGEVILAADGVNQYSGGKAAPAGCTAFALWFLKHNPASKAEALRENIRTVPDQYRVAQALNTPDVIKDMNLLHYKQIPMAITNTGLSADYQPDEYKSDIESIQIDLNPESFGHALKWFMENKDVEGAIFIGNDITIALRKDPNDPRRLQFFDSHGMNEFTKKGAGAYLLTYEIKNDDYSAAIDYLKKRYPKFTDILDDGDLNLGYVGDQMNIYLIGKS